MSRRLILVIWFLAVIAVIPLGIAVIFVPSLRETFFWTAGVAAVPFVMSIVEYVLTGDTKATKVLLGRRVPP